MGVMDKFLNAMKLNDDDDYAYEDDFYDDDDVVEEKHKKSSSKDVSEDFEDKNKKNTPKVTPMRQAKRNIGAGMEVCVIKPSSVEDAREITETLLASRTVLLNLEGLDVDIAQRIIDFSSGSCYAIDGNLQKVSNFIFIITPSGVEVSGDFQEILNGVDMPSLGNKF